MLFRDVLHEARVVAHRHDLGAVAHDPRVTGQPMPILVRLERQLARLEPQPRLLDQQLQPLPPGGRPLVLAGPAGDQRVEVLLEQRRLAGALAPPLEQLHVNPLLDPRPVAQVQVGQDRVGRHDHQGRGRERQQGQQGGTHRRLLGPVRR